jgi:acetate---CoA ligase (ADP-forming)
MLSGYDAGIFVIDPPRSDRCDPSSFQPALDAIEAAAADTGKPAFPVASLPENFDEALAIAMIERGIAPLMGLEAALGALTAASMTEPGRAGWRPWPADGVRPVPLRLLDESAAKVLLAQAGVAVPRGVSAPDLPTLRIQATALTPPLALKGLGFAHKTEAGAVRLGLSSLADQAPIPEARGYLAEEMVQGAVAEVLLGLRRDPVYGATLTLGFGGVTAELLADTATLVLPCDGEDILAALRGLRLWPLLDGYRGRPRADVAALVATSLALMQLLQARPDIEEIEVNPLILRAEGCGAVAVDALIRVEDETWK